MGFHCFGINIIWLEILAFSNVTKTHMGYFHSSTVETCSKDTCLIPTHNGQFHLSQYWNISYNFSKNSPLSTDTGIIQTLFHIIFYPLVSVLTGFLCTWNKYSCGTKRNPHCCSLRVGNVEPGSVVSLKGRYTLGNKLQQHVATTLDYEWSPIFPQS